MPAPRSNPKTSVYDDLLNQGSDEEYGGPPVKARGPAVHIGRGGRGAFVCMCVCVFYLLGCCVTF